jgi:hypothetical protein
MSKHTVSAKGGAMPAEANEENDVALVQVADELSDVSDLIEAVHMAASDLDEPRACNALKTLLDVVCEKLDATRAKLDAARGQPEMEDTAHA